MNKIAHLPAPAPLRLASILETLRREGFVSVADLAQRAGVSAMTIRRDLEGLERRGLLSRTHGGAMALDTQGVDLDEPAFEQRRARNAGAKHAIARTAAGLIGPAEAVGLDIGTTVLALADALCGRGDLHFVTGSLRAAARLADGPSPVTLLGGQVRAAEHAVVGATAARQLEGLALHRFFLGVSGITPGGVYDYAPEETEVKRGFIAAAAQVVVLADHEKFGRRALSRIAGLDGIHTLVTDRAPQGALAAALAEAGVRIIIAEEPA